MNARLTRPDCAMCYWGEGWACGSYLNGPMSADQSPFADYAMQRAILAASWSRSDTWIRASRF